MSEQLDRIEQELRGFRKETEARFDRIERQTDARFGEIEGKLQELGHNMRVLHGDALERIAATQEYPGPTREEFAAFEAKFDRRLDLLEGTLPLVREHETAIRDHEARLDAIERTAK